VCHLPPWPSLCRGPDVRLTGPSTSDVPRARSRPSRCVPSRTRRHAYMTGAAQHCTTRVLRHGATATACARREGRVGRTPTLPVEAAPAKLCSVAVRNYDEEISLPCSDSNLDLQAARDCEVAEERSLGVEHRPLEEQALADEDGVVRQRQWRQRSTRNASDLTGQAQTGCRSTAGNHHPVQCCLHRASLPGSPATGTALAQR
jgi:hypothetical protein